MWSALNGPDKAGLNRYAGYFRYGYSLLLPLNAPFLDFSFSTNGICAGSGPTQKSPLPSPGHY